MRSSAEVDDVLLDGRVRAGLEGLRVEGVDGEEGRVVVTVDPGLRVGLVALDRPEVALTATRETSAMKLRARWVRFTHELSPKSFQVSCSTKSYLERDSTSSSQRFANRKPSERYSPEKEERRRLNQRRMLASAKARDAYSSCPMSTSRSECRRGERPSRYRPWSCRAQRDTTSRTTSRSPCRTWARLRDSQVSERPIDRELDSKTDLRSS